MSTKIEVTQVNYSDPTGNQSVLFSIHCKAEVSGVASTMKAMTEAILFVEDVRKLTLPPPELPPAPPAKSAKKKPTRKAKR